MTAGVVAIFKYWGLHDLALLVLTSWVAYLRPGEARALKVKDLVAPAPQKRRHGQGAAFGDWALVVAPQEDYALGKTGTFDDTIALDTPKWLGPALKKAASRRRPGDALLPVGAALSVGSSRWRRRCTGCLGCASTSSDTGARPVTF